MAVAAPERPVKTEAPYTPKKIRIEVTEEDIGQGLKGSSLQCPIALALRRHSHGEFVFVTALGIVCRAGSPPYILPEEAQIFIHRFDRGLPVTPFAFDAFDLA